MIQRLMLMKKEDTSKKDKKERYTEFYSYEQKFESKQERLNEETGE